MENDRIPETWKKVEELLSPKIEYDQIDIARIQIEQAISLYLKSANPVLILTLLYPASQIIRDLNRGNARALSNAFTEVIREMGHPPGAFWKEFNSKSNFFKHATKKMTVSIKEVCSEIYVIETIMFVILEYRAHFGTTVSIPMYHHIQHYQDNIPKISAKKYISKWTKCLIYLKIQIHRFTIDSKIAVAKSILKILHRMHKSVISK